ncbi:uncharacterized protein LOC123617638 isoform X2 [Camelus bactrianus]|uniref:Uncharacterized protein LOC123617638 isoform X2 n=2 Tax=Camelus bactrianus TaxID=9837 RepID=A0A9W3HJZ1_CAMBA|nr:uncharacterized protein LOC123617638 isoform X2 [Camelus bactrianus]
MKPSQSTESKHSAHCWVSILVGSCFSRASDSYGREAMTVETLGAPACRPSPAGCLDARLWNGRGTAGPDRAIRNLPPQPRSPPPRKGGPEQCSAAVSPSFLCCLTWNHTTCLCPVSLPVSNRPQTRCFPPGGGEQGWQLFRAEAAGGTSAFLNTMLVPPPPDTWTSVSCAPA